MEDIDLSKISYDLTEDEKKTASPDFLPVAKYSSGEKTTILGPVSYTHLNLFPLMTVCENVMYPLKLLRHSDADAKKEAQIALEKVRCV